MKTLSEMLHGCMLFVSSKPTKRQLLKMDSNLISPIERPTWDCGVHVRYLVTAFESVSPDWTAQDLLQRVVLPQTSAWRCRYVDTIDTSLVGRATYFVSYNVQAPFHQMVDAIKRRFYDVNGQELPDAADAYLWIDTFAANHHIVGNKIEYTQVQDILRHCYACLVLLDGKCRVFSRLLPLYEIWATLHVSPKSTHGVRVEVLPACTDPRYLRNEWLHLNVRNGSALRDFDKDWVLDQLMSRGVQRVNHMIREALANGARRLASNLSERAAMCEHLFMLEEEEGQEEMVQSFDAAGLAHDLHVCANIIQLHGHYTEAIGVYKQAVRVWQLARTQLAHENPLTLLMHYTELLLLLKRWEEARVMAEEAYELSVQVAEEHARGKGYTSLSGAHFSTEVYAVDRGGNAAAARVPEPVGLGTPPWMHCQILLARAMAGLGDHDRAEFLVREVYTAQAERVSKLPPRLAQKLRRDQMLLQHIRLDSRADKAKALMALADILRLTLRDNTALESIKLYLRAQKGLSKALGKTHPDVAYVQMRIGQLLRSQKKLDQACQVLSGVLLCYASSWGEHHPETASAMVYLADVELAMLGIRDYEFTDADRQSALQRATRQYMQAFEIRKTCLGINHPDTLATLGAAIVQLLNSSTSRLQLSKVEPMCSLAAKCSMAMHAQQSTDQFALVPSDISRKLGGNVVSCLVFMGVMLATAAKPKEACHMFDEAERKAAAELPSSHQYSAHCFLCQADLLHVQHEWLQAEDLYRKSLAVYATLLGPAIQVAQPPAQEQQSTFAANSMRSLARMSGVVMKSLAKRTSANLGARRFDATTTFDAATTMTAPDASGSSMTKADFNRRMLSTGRTRRLSLSNAGTPENVIVRTGVSMSGATQLNKASSRFAGKSGMSFVQPSPSKLASGSLFAAMRSTSTRYPSGLESARQSVDEGSRMSWDMGPRTGGGVTIGGGPVAESGPTPPWISVPPAEDGRPSASFNPTATSQTLGRVSSPRGTPTTSKGPPHLNPSALSRVSGKQGYGSVLQSLPSTPTGGFPTASKLFNSRSLRQKSAAPVLLTEMLAPQCSAPGPPSDTFATNFNYAAQNAGLDTLFSTMALPQDTRDMDNPLFTTNFMTDIGLGTQSVRPDGRQSAFSKFARKAGSRIVATLSAISTGPPKDEQPAAGQMTMHNVKERVVQPPKLGETLVNPHQLVLVRRGKLADDMVALLKSEAAVVANNYGLLCRWLENATECEAQLRFALSLFLPSKVLGVLLPVIKEPATSPRATLQQQAPTFNDTLNFTNMDLRPYMMNTMTQTQNLNATPGSFTLSQTLASQLMESVKNATSQETLSGVVGSTEWRQKLHVLLAGQDPQVVYVAALMISNLASFLASQGRSAEAVELYWHALVYCTHVSRGTDAMIIALNLLQLLSSRMWSGDLELCKAVLKRYVGPQLGGQVGLDNTHLGGGRHAATIMQKAMQEAGLQPPASRPGSESSLARAHEHGPMVKMQLQILEALATRIVDDGGQVLYQWAANTMARFTKQPGYVKPPQLPQTVFLIQVPGVHLECVHMVRWLLVVDPSLGSATDKPTCNDIHSHICGTSWL